MSEQGILDRLRELRADAVSRIADLPDDQCRRQFHPALSPLSWHLGHAFFVEAYWLHEMVCGDGERTRPLHELFFPELNAKSGRAGSLPHRDTLLAWCTATAADNDAAWARIADHRHPLLSKDYLPAFLAQHYAQHLETMDLVAQQRALSLAEYAMDRPLPDALTAPASGDTARAKIDGGAVAIGSSAGTRAAYDNEQPIHEHHLAAYAIARRPVSNAQWLAFMIDEGYRREDIWDAEGLTWRTENDVRAPDHWRAHPSGGWYALTEDGVAALRGDRPVFGINHFEASAYARWAGGHLPHEYQWERAARAGMLEQVGSVWEWCANPLHPYPGFRAFPYEGYSTPWFDNRHFVLRGGSRHTRPEIRRAGFRNFYTADVRHIFAGLRLIWPA